MEVLVHTKVYSFADKYLIPDLEAFATRRLAQVLIILEHKQVEMLPQLAEAIQVTYSTTPTPWVETSFRLPQNRLIIKP